MRRFRLRLQAVIAVATLFALAGCGWEAAARTEGTISCTPNPRFRVGGIEYEVRSHHDEVPSEDVGELIAADLVQPPEIPACVSHFELKDGETSLGSGTDVYAITGVAPAVALTASIATDVYVRFHASP